MIQIENILKIYDETKEYKNVILDNCSLKIDKSERIIITGENGSGKTTLLKIIGLLDKNYKGYYSIDSQDVSTMSSSEIAKLRNEYFGFVFQDYNLMENENAYDNIIVPLLYSKKIARKDRKKIIYSMAEIFEISHLLQKKVKYLSGGERQRIAIARACINQPKLLILDEPTNALNFRLKAKLLNYIEDSISDETSIIIVTHDLSLIEMPNYKCYELKNGKLHSFRWCNNYIEKVSCF